METLIALLRAVNVGGTGKLPMSDLKTLCEKAGFRDVRTYIASGNVVFESDRSEAQVKATLAAALKKYAGKPVGVLVRGAAEMAEILAANPFPKAAPNRTVVIFLDQPPPDDALDAVVGRNGEEIRLGKREIYVHYGDGMADSKLKIRAAEAGTARNMNTVAKLVAMAQAAKGSWPRQTVADRRQRLAASPLIVPVDPSSNALANWQKLPVWPRKRRLARGLLSCPTSCARIENRHESRLQRELSSSAFRLRSRSTGCPHSWRDVGRNVGRQFAAGIRRHRCHHSCCRVRRSTIRFHQHDARADAQLGQ